MLHAFTTTCHRRKSLTLQQVNRLTTRCSTDQDSHQTLPEVSLGFSKGTVQHAVGRVLQLAIARVGLCCAWATSHRGASPRVWGLLPTVWPAHFSARFGVGELDRSKPGPGLWFRPQEVASELPTNQPGGCVLSLATPEVPLQHANS
jgi:hypothetical protein